MTPRMKEKFDNEIKQEIKASLKLKNIHEIPNMEKIIINIGDGKASTDGRALESMVDELTAISGQKPVVRRAKKSIAGFKIREGMPVGVSVTLRGDRMWEFYDRFVQVAVPRIRDFRGFSKKHQKPQGQTMQGGVIDKTMPIDVSNVAIVVKNKFGRVSYKFDKTGQKYRVLSKTGDEV